MKNARFSGRRQFIVSLVITMAICLFALTGSYKGVGGVGFVFSEEIADLNTNCSNINEQITIDIPCIEFDKTIFRIALEVYTNPIDSNGLYFRLIDIPAISESDSSCAFISNNFNINISCAVFDGSVYTLSLESYDNPLDNEWLYWKFVESSNVNEIVDANTTRLKSSIRASSSVPEANTGFTWPLPYSFSNNGGYYFKQEASYSGGYVYHPGEDWNVPSSPGGSCNGDKGLNVVAVANGKVTYKNSSSWAGLVVEHNYKGEKWYSQYGHVQNIIVAVGDIVTKGQKIAEIGDVGTSCAHLHFEIRESDHPNASGSYWTYGTNGLYNTANIDNWYESPTIFIPAHPAYSSVTTGGVYGKLYENSTSGSTLSGATVTCGGKSTTTNSSGSYTLTGISTGWQTLKFSKSGYQSYEKGVYINAGQNADAGKNYIVKNPTTGGVYGKLKINSTSGSSLSGATVTCGGKSTTTNSSGSYTLTGISTGWQTLKFSKSGYQSYEKGVYINAGKNTDAGTNYLVKK